MFSVKILLTVYLAFSASKVGGSLKESLKVVYGLNTFPATEGSGNPAAPITSSFGSHPLPSKAFKGFVVTA